MVWQPPKQDWKAGDVPSSSDFNRIERNTQDIRNTIDSHINNKNNPHGVTKSQVGLGNLLNYAVATIAQAEAGTSNAAYMTPLRTAQAIAAWFERNTQDLRNTINSHINNKNNPHGVTKSQVGLGNLLNYAVATVAQAEEGTSNAAYMTPLRTMQAIAAWFERNVGGIIKMSTFEDSVTINPDSSGNIYVYYPSGAECKIGGIAILAPSSKVTPFYTGAIAIAKARSMGSLMMFHHVCYNWSVEGNEVPNGYVLVSPVATEHMVGSSVLQRQYSGQFGKSTFLYYLMFGKNKLTITLRNEHGSNANTASVKGTYLII